MQTQVNNDTTVVIEKQYTSQQMNLQLLMRASKGWAINNIKTFLFLWGLLDSR